VTTLEVGHEPPESVVTDNKSVDVSQLLHMSHGVVYP